MVAPVIAAAIPVILEFGGRLIDKIFPDPATADQHKLELLKLAQEGQLAELTQLVDQLRVEAEDRASARQREIATGDQATPRILAGIMVTGFFLVLAWLLSEGMPAQGGEALLVLLGALSSGVAAVLSYYFGSSSSSGAKNATIQALTEQRK
jgi:hypothetical protein